MKRIVFATLVVLVWAHCTLAAPIYIEATYLEYGNGDNMPEPASAEQVVTEILKLPDTVGTFYPGEPDFYEYLPGFTNFSSMLSWSIIDDPRLPLVHLSGPYPYDKLVVSVTPLDVWLQTHPFPGGQIPETQQLIVAPLTAAPLTLTIPEPSTLMLGVAGLAGLAFSRWRRQRSR